jgi:DNA-binding MarR family transcriptional regulator
MTNQDLVNQDAIIDALGTAKATLNLLPKLPPNIKPVHIRVLIAIYRIRDDTGCARITDIAKTSRFLLPNVTKLVNEIVSLNILEKFSSASDKREVLVRATTDGEQYMQYIQFLRQRFEEELAGINETDRQVMIVTINKVFKAIKRACEEIKDKEAYPYDR